jgi:hypothetical protein
MERCAKTLDLFIRDRSSLPLIAHESKHTRRPQYFQSLFGRLRDSDKCIAAEHGDFHHAPSVAPLVDLTQQWKKRAHTFFFKLRSDPLFVPGHGVNRVPARFLRSVIQSRNLPYGFDVDL